MISQLGDCGGDCDNCAGGLVGVCISTVSIELKDLGVIVVDCAIGKAVKQCA